MSIISVKHLSKQFGNKKLFQDLSFEIDEKEVVALVGPSGCGKSTILNMIGLLEPIEQGNIYIHNKPLPSVNSKKAIIYRREIINYLFQSNALISSASVKDNLMLAMHFTDLSMKQKEEKIKESLDIFNLKSAYTNTINELSGGEQQRITIVRSVLKPGDIILADEPTGSLDPVMAQKSFDFIKDLRDHFDKTVLMVTHNMEQANQCDRIIHLY